MDAAALGRAAVDDARLVEMDVRLDQPATGQPPAGIVRLRLRRQATSEVGCSDGAGHFRGDVGHDISRRQRGDRGEEGRHDEDAGREAEHREARDRPVDRLAPLVHPQGR